MRSRSPVWIALAVAVAAALVAAGSPRPVLPPFLPVGDHATYTAASPAALVLVEPVAHAPWFGAASLPWTMAVAALATALLWSASRAVGGSILAAVLVVAAVWSRPELRAMLSLGADGIVASALVWGIVAVFGAGFGHRRTTAWVGLLMAGAAARWPPIAVVAPLVAAAAARHGMVAAAIVPAAAAGGIVAGLAGWAARASALGQEAVGVVDVLRVVATADPRGSAPSVWPEATALLLPATLALIGAADMLKRSGARRRELATLAIAVLGVVVIVWTFPGWRDELRRAVSWTAWPWVAAGLMWLARQAPGRAALVQTAFGIALVGGGLSAPIRTVEDTDRQAFSAALADALAEATAGTPTTVVAEDTRVDAAITAWAGGSGLHRARPVPRRIDAALEEGRQVLAGPEGRTVLELWGFRFATRAAVTAPARFAMAASSGRYRCVPVASAWRELPGLEYTGRLGLHVPATPGRLEVVIVGPPPLTPRLTWSDGRPVGRVTPLPLDLPSLPPVLWPGDGRLPDPSQVALRVELDGRPEIAQDASLFLGQRAPLVAVRFTEPAHLTGVATACAAPLPRDPVEGPIPLDDDVFFAGGWHGVEGRAPVRWTAKRAIVLVPAASTRDVEIVMRARTAAADGVTLTASVNGWPAGALPIGGDDTELRWRVPGGVWIEGTNEVALEVSAVVRTADTGGTDGRELGAAVSSLQILAR